MDRMLFVLAFGMSLMMGCGGGSTKYTPADGRIYLWNDTSSPLQVKYLNSELGEIETEVDPGQTEDVSQALLEGGTKVILEVTSSAYIMQILKRIEVSIDGNVTVRITKVESPNTIEYEIS